METLKYNKERGIDPYQLRRIGVLSYFEGPLLVLYEHAQNKHLYLVDWVDRDQTNNRWLIYRTEARDVLKFINGQISQRVVMERTIPSQLFIADVATGKTLLQSSIINILDIPSTYLPDEDIFFDPEDCADSYKQIKAAVMDALGTSKLDNSLDISKPENFSNVIESPVHSLLNCSYSSSYWLPEKNCTYTQARELQIQIDEMKDKIFELRSTIAFIDASKLLPLYYQLYGNILDHTQKSGRII